MKVPIRLKQLDLDVIHAIHVHGVSRADDLVAALVLIRQTGLDFGKLLKKVLAAGRLTTMQLFKDGDDYKALLPEVSQSIDALVLYGYLLKTPIHREVQVGGKRPTSVPVTHALSLTPEGGRVAEALVRKRRLMLRSAPTDQTSVFVACAFNRPELDQLYRQELAPACATLNLTAYRVDTVEPAATITDELLQGIRDARIMVADLTHARPSVYFEVGVAHGLGVPVVLTCRSDHDPGASDAQRVHFDLRQFKISYWTLCDGVFEWKGGSPLERMRLLVPRG